MAKKKTEKTLDEAVEKLKNVETTKEVIKEEVIKEESKTVIPEPAKPSGDLKVESLNQKNVIIDEKSYSINRSEHKAIVSGNKEVIAKIVKK